MLSQRKMETVCQWNSWDFKSSSQCQPVLVFQMKCQMGFQMVHYPRGWYKHTLVIQWTFSFLVQVWAEMGFLGRIFTCWKNIWGQARLHSLWITKKVCFTVIELSKYPSSTGEINYIMWLVNSKSEKLTGLLVAKSVHLLDFELL